MFVCTSEAGGNAASLLRPDSEDDDADPFIDDNDDSPPPPPPAAGALLAEVEPASVPSSRASDVEPSLPVSSSGASEVEPSLRMPSSGAGDVGPSLPEPSSGAYEVEYSLQEPSSGASAGVAEHFSVDDIGPRSLEALLAEIDSPDVKVREEPSASASLPTSTAPGQDREKLLALVAAGTAKLAELLLFRIWSAVYCAKHAWAE